MVLLLLAAAAVVPASAQLTAAKNAEVAMGHHHLNVTDIGAHTRFWSDLLGGEHVKLGRTDVMKFPNALVFLRQQASSGGTRGTIVNHVGFHVRELKSLISKLKQAGVPIVTRTEISGGRAKGDIYHIEAQNLYLAFVLGPDDIKVELLEDSSMDVPIENHHIHFYGPDIPGMKSWYVKMLGAKPGRRGNFEAADVPGVNLTFSGAEGKAKGLQGTVLDHIGFEVKNLEAFCKKLEAMGIRFDRPYRKIDSINLGIAFLTDPWGTYIELTEGLDAL